MDRISTKMEKPITSPDKLRELVAKKFKTMNNTDFTKEAEDKICQLTYKIINSIINDDNSKKINSSSAVDRKGHHSTGKVFVARNSLFTDLMQIPHIRSLYHMFISIFIILFLNSIANSMIDGKPIDVGLNIIMAGFAKFHLVTYIWLFMQSYAILLYGFFIMWVVCRNALKKNQFFCDVLAIIFMILYQIVYVVIPLVAVYRSNLPFVSGFVVLTEMARFMMKTHAFVRSVSPRVLNNSNISIKQVPSFSWYMYFLFVPTLIYRDSYPRTDSIKWAKVFRHLLEFIITLFYLSYLSETFIVNLWVDYGPQMHIFASKQIITKLLNSIVPNFLTTLCGFYELQHCWFNITAELLKFADRQFYGDWWNQTDYSGFYRTWNVVVHDWLYTYIYKDVTLLTKSRSFGMFAVFAVSAVFHEIILAFAMGFFYPVLLFMFGGFGFLFKNISKYINSSVGNPFLLLTFAVGSGILYCMYSIEYFARINCPMIETSEFYDFFIPRSWFCY